MKRKIDFSLLIIFVAIEICFVYLIVFSNLPGNSYYCFFSIFVCFLFSVYLIRKENQNYLITIALFFTVISDVFLVLVQPRIQWLAMTTFSICQLLYFALILSRVNAKNLKWHAIVRVIVVVSVIVVTACVLREKTDYLSLISMFYFSNLICNVVEAFIQIKINPIFAIGFLFFLFCDFFVGLNSAVGVYIFVSESSFIYKLAFPPINLAWLFYIPSQTLITLSMFDFKKHRKL